jgi:hypothetical protein
VVNGVAVRAVWIRRALAVDPRIRRVGYAVFANHQLVDWGMRNLRKGTRDLRVRQALIPYLISLLDGQHPSVLVVPRVGTGGFRRSRHVVSALDALVREARKRDIPVVSVTPEQLRASFTATTGKPRPSEAPMNRSVIDRYPELTSSLPRQRRLWDPEDYFTPMFRAVAMYVAWRHRTT